MPPTTGTPKRAAGLGHAVDGLGELPHHLGVLGVAEVEAVHERPAGGRPRRPGSAPTSATTQRRAAAGVDGAPPVVAVGGEGQRPGRCPRRCRGAFSRSTVASPPGPSTVLRNSWWSYWRHTQPLSPSMPSRSAPTVRAARRPATGVGPRAAAGRPGAARAGRRAGRRRAATTPARRPAPRRRSRRGCAGGRRVGDPPDDGGPHLPPPRRGRATSSRSLGLDDGQHPLLALGGHHLEGLHARFAPGHGRDVDVHAHAAAWTPSRWWRRSARRRRGPGCRPPGPASSSARQASISRFSSKGSPTCTLGRLASSPRRRRSRPTPARSRRRCRRAPSSTPAARPGCPRRAPGRARAGRPGRSPRHSTFTSGLPCVGARRRRPRRRPSARRRRCRSREMPLHDALGDPTAAGVVERTEPQRVHQGDGTGAHGEDVAQDAADARGRALVGLDGRRVVVALDADGGGDPVADIDHAGVLARADEHPRRLGRADAGGGRRDDL